MAAQRRKFQRPLGERRYKKLFLIAAEGIKTEPIYFALFADDTSIVWVRCLKGKHDSSPPQVLRRMTDHLERERLKRWIPDYDKGVDTRKISLSQIDDAIRRAKKRDHPPCEDWPRSIGQTTVYRLIENIVNARTE